VGGEEKSKEALWRLCGGLNTSMTDRIVFTGIEDESRGSWTVDERFWRSGEGIVGG
jgi:hypothetical protein